MLFSKLGQSSKRCKLRNIFETVLIILIVRLSLFVYTNINYLISTARTLENITFINGRKKSWLIVINLRTLTRSRKILWILCLYARAKINVSFQIREIVQSLVTNDRLSSNTTKRSRFVSRATVEKRIRNRKKTQREILFQIVVVFGACARIKGNWIPSFHACCWFGEHSHSVAFLSRLQVSWHVFCAASGTRTSLRPSRTSLTSVLDRGKVPSRVEGARKTKCFSKKLINVWPILKRPALQNVPVFHFSVAPCKTEYFLLNKHYHRTIPPAETVSRLPREKQRVGRWPVEKVTKLKSWGTKFSWNDRLSRCSNNTFIQP